MRDSKIKLGGNKEAETVEAYKRRMGIEEMFRNCKSGGYSLESTGLRGERLNAMILVMSLAYFQSTMRGCEISKYQGQKYVCCTKEFGRIYRRRSTFGVGWVRWRKLGEKFGTISPRGRRINRFVLP